MTNNNQNNNNQNNNQSNNEHWKQWNYQDD